MSLLPSLSPDLARTIKDAMTSVGRIVVQLEKINRQLGTLIKLQEKQLNNNTHLNTN